MAKISQLPIELANKIAAGEVVERPASVAKELIENALDAGAQSITVEIRQGGLRRLSVADDGCGIAAEDLPTAFLRHATSKLHTAEELSAIGTLGFRGEALAAIAAVARVEIVSRTIDCAEGTQFRIEGGIAGGCSPCGCPVGTRIVVEDLFFNTPARLKFMKKDSVESAAIAGLVQHLSLSHPDVSFKLIRDGEETLHTPGDGLLRSAVYAALGRDFALSLLPLRMGEESFCVDGFITRPLSGRGTRGMQIFFVNGRFIKSQLLTAALEEAYANRQMKGRFPGCVLHLTVPCELVDVNVHPAKTMVKFAQEKAVFDLVYRAAFQALMQETVPEHQPSTPAGGKEFFQTVSAADYRTRASGTVRETAKPSSSKSSLYMTLHDSGAAAPVRQKEAPYQRQNIFTRESVSPQERNIYSEREPQYERALPQERTAPQENDTQSTQEQMSLLPPTEKPWRLIGETMDTYILCESAEGELWLIDKHAAHERMLFDRLREQRSSVMGQPLLQPITAHLSGEEYTVLYEHLSVLEEFGFSCEPVGDTCLQIREIPAQLPADEAVAGLEELARRLLSHNHADVAIVRDELLHTMACKAAIKGGMHSAQEELYVIMEAVRLGQVQYCPHGRPVAVKLGRNSLEKMFKRA